MTCLVTSFGTAAEAVLRGYRGSFHGRKAYHGWPVASCGPEGLPSKGHCRAGV